MEVSMLVINQVYMTWMGDHREIYSEADHMLMMVGLYDGLHEASGRNELPPSPDSWSERQIYLYSWMRGLGNEAMTHWLVTGEFKTFPDLTLDVHPDKITFH